MGDREKKTLRDQLSNAMVWSHYDKKDFLPTSTLAQILSVCEVASHLGLKQSDELLTFIIQDAIKVFATVIRVAGQNEEALSEVMDSFRLNRFTDSLLPIHDFECNFRRDSQQCRHSDQFNVFHGHNWGSSAIKDFCNEQWAFLAPVFSTENFIHKLAPMHILPFEWVDDFSNMRPSGFSEVRKVKFHPEHLTVVENEPGALHVALKKLKPQSNETGSSVDRLWQTEVDALQAANISRNPHLNTSLGAFSRDGEYFFVLQWADEGNLKEFWMKTPTPTLDADLIRDVLSQLLGLAKALRDFHNPGSPTGLGFKFKSKPNENWRHGDLKPENVLVCSVPVGSTRKLGTLQIADLGLAKRHTAATRERAGKTSQTCATITYGPPEAQFLEEHPRSRVYDIWSMGCIILEFMIWLLWGKDGWKTFTHEPFPLNLKDTLFYTMGDDGKAKVSDVATHWMRLIQDDPECNEQPHTALWDLLKLVNEKLLVVAIDYDGTGREKCRATASILCQELQSIIDHADRNSSYLLKVVDRTKIPRPRGLRNTYLTPPGGAAPNLPHAPQEGAEDGDVLLHVPDAKLSDIWKFTIDNDFAREVLRRIPQEAFPSLRNDPKLCEKCTNLDFSQLARELEFDVAQLEGVPQGCDLCRLLLQSCNRLMIEGRFVLHRDGSNLKRPGSSLPILSICSVPAGNEQSFGNIQIGFPSLLEAGSTAHLEVIGQWLRHCDEHHQCSLSSHSHPPTRLLDVAMQAETSAIRLFDTEEEKLEDPRFLALSYQWGDRKIHPRFCTTRENLLNHKQKIDLDDLPLTLRDAVAVTRGLGIRYLWIDALCIVQGDKEDWGREAKRMEGVFSSAYCVLAASQAGGACDGFLSSRLRRDYVKVSTSSAGTVYVCEAIDDFDRDVAKGGLNKRGWVYQERALARRTIHFTEVQTYWECGYGIRCETMTRMENNTTALFGDPDFPKLAMKLSKGGRIVFFETFYKQYSRLALSRQTDMPLAIAGLEIRLIHALEVHGGYGIFDSHRPEATSYLGRSLLWRRGSEISSMVKIESSPGCTFKVPSWSWMSYHGGIDYLNAPFDGVDWEREEIQSPWARSLEDNISWHTADRISSTRLTAKAREFSDPEDRIYYDSGVKPVAQRLLCVVVGRSKAEVLPDLKTHYLLIIGEREGMDWERVGAGELMGQHLELKGRGLSVLIS